MRRLIALLSRFLDHTLGYGDSTPMPPRTTGDLITTFHDARLDEQRKHQALDQAERDADASTVARAAAHDRLLAEVKRGGPIVEVDAGSVWVYLVYPLADDFIVVQARDTSALAGDDTPAPAVEPEPEPEGFGVADSFGPVS